MQAWNQWGSQPSGSGGYSMPGFPPPVSGVPPPSVGGGPTGATPVPSPISGYPLPGYQWPNYTPSSIPSTVGAYPGTQWPLSQHSQQWEHWQQWQQQYSQWQQQYGDKFAAATAGLQSASGDAASQPSPQISQTSTTTGNDTAKRSYEGSSDNNSPSQETKKAHIDGQNTSEDWSTTHKPSTKDGFEELSEAEKQFDEQFRSWETQFNAWREQNANHPDTEQYKAYEDKWKSWREQLLQRREQMRKKREAKLNDAAAKQKQASQAIASTVVSSAPTQTTSQTVTTSATSTSQQAVPSFTQNPVGLYGQMGFPGYSFNQQNYMFGMNPAGAPTAFPGGTQSIFHGVPPPVLTGNLSADPSGLSLKNADISKSVKQSLDTVESKEKQSEFLKSNSGNGIPGLDLLNASGAHSKPSCDAPSMILPPQVQLPIQTPADSKPFDFPPPSLHSQNSQNMGKFGMDLMAQMNMPPPGFPSMPPMYGFPPNSKSNSFSQPPPQINKDMNKDMQMNKSAIPSLMDGFDSKRASVYSDRSLLKDRAGSDWPLNDRNFSAGLSSDKFDCDSRYPFPGRNNELVNNFDRLNQKGKENDGLNRAIGNFNDDRRSNWRNESPYRGSTFREGINNYGGYGHNRGYPSRDDGRLNNFRSDDFVENEEDEYERFHEYQQSAENQTEKPPIREFRSDRLTDQGNKLEGQRGPRISRFTDREPFTENSPDLFANKFGSQSFSNRQEPQDVPRDAFLNKKESDFSVPDYGSDRYGRWDYEKGDRALESNAKPDLPPLLEPAVIIDYRHQPADLGIPEFHEPASMVDYAHGAHILPVGEEERFPPHGPDSRPQDRWGSDRDRGRSGMMGYNKMSPNRHWNDTRDRDMVYDSRNKWNSPGPRGRDDRRWEGPKDDYKRDRDSRSKDDSRGRDDKGGRDGRDDNRGRDDRWRGDRGKPDSNHDDRNKQNRESDKKDRDNKGRERNDDRRSQPNNNKTRSPSPKPAPKPIEEQKQVVVLADDILTLPGRSLRSPKIVVILRGPPGSGKTFVAKLIKDKEIEMGGSAPRILSLDDYFMTEVEREEEDTETGKKVNKKVMEYEYEKAMEPNYRDSLTKSFKKTIIDGYFPFIIVDCINSKMSHFEEMAAFAKQKGFQIYICEMDMDLAVCTKRNIHKRTEKEIDEILKGWEKTSSSYVSLDIRSLLQDAAITEVDMEDSADVSKEVLEEKSEVAKEEPSENKDKEKENDEDQSEKEKPPEGLMASTFSSKWDNLDSSYDKLDRLDGLAKARRPRPSITDWLQLPEDYFETPVQVSGKKRVRWADLEERRQQEKMRAIGFVVGQTDWSRMLDPSGGQSKLTQTKYI